MRCGASAVDDAHTMTSTNTTTTTTLQGACEQLDQLFAAAAGRFGRQVRTLAQADPELTPTRSDAVARMRVRMQASDYRVDPLVVSDAIVDRVVYARAS